MPVEHCGSFPQVAPRDPPQQRIFPRNLAQPAGPDGTCGTLLTERCLEHLKTVVYNEISYTLLQVLRKETVFLQNGAHRLRFQIGPVRISDT